MEDIEGFISEINNKSRKAFEMLYQLYYRELVYFSSKLNVSDHEAEDIVHDVMLNLWEGKYLFENILALRSFLYTAVRNRTLNQIKRGNRTINDMSQYSEDGDDNELTTGIVETEVISILDMAISRLPAECARIMQKLLEGKSSADMAIELNLASSTVRAQKRRGLSLLKKILPDDLYFIMSFMV